MIVPLLSLLLPAVLPAVAIADGVGGHASYMHDHGWAGFVFGPLMMILFIALAVAAAAFVLRHLGAIPSGNRALRILEERFARGEIDADEFAARRRTLEG